MVVADNGLTLRMSLFSGAQELCQGCSAPLSQTLPPRTVRLPFEMTPMAVWTVHEATTPPLPAFSYRASGING
jgi:hypothetical protein